MYLQIKTYAMFNKTYLLVALLFTGGIMLFHSCRKDLTDLLDLAALNMEQSVDIEDINSSTEEIDDEIEDLISESSLKSAITSNLLCNVTIDSSFIVNKKITITFNGDNCKGNRSRNGVVIIELTKGVKWQDVGAELTVTFQNLKITNTSTNKYIVLNGTKSHTNVTGGLVINLGNEGTPDAIVRKIVSENMKVTFANGSQRNWNIARMKTFTKSVDGYIITISGFGEADGHTNLVEWGTNRRGNEFYTEITEPVVYSQTCDYNPSSGKKIHYVGTREIEVTLGTDSSGNPVTDGCADYYEVVWLNSEDVKRTEIIHY